MDMLPTCTILSLPDEILAHIFDLVPVTNLRTAMSIAHVCRRFRHVIKSGMYTFTAMEALKFDLTACTPKITSILPVGTKDTLLPWQADDRIFTISSTVITKDTSHCLPPKMISICMKMESKYPFSDRCLQKFVEAPKDTRIINIEYPPNFIINDRRTMSRDELYHYTYKHTVMFVEALSAFVVDKQWILKLPVELAGSNVWCTSPDFIYIFNNRGQALSIDIITGNTAVYEHKLLPDRDWHFVGATASPVCNNIVSMIQSTNFDSSLVVSTIDINNIGGQRYSCLISCNRTLYPISIEKYILFAKKGDLLHVDATVPKEIVVAEHVSSVAFSPSFMCCMTNNWVRVYTLDNVENGNIRNVTVIPTPRTVTVDVLHCTEHQLLMTRFYPIGEPVLEVLEYGIEKKSAKKQLKLVFMK